MSGGVSITTVAAVATAAAAVGSAAYTLTRPTPKAPGAVAAPTPPQLATAPDANSQLRAQQAGDALPGGGAGGGGGGPSSTLLTGGTGVDPSSLSLGKNTLLGSD